MRLPLDVARCCWSDCPLRHGCLRFTDIPAEANVLPWLAGFQPWEQTKRGPQCDLMIPTPPPAPEKEKL